MCVEASSLLRPLLEPLPSRPWSWRFYAIGMVSASESISQSGQFISKGDAVILLVAS